MKYIDSIISKKQRQEMDSWNHWFGILTCFYDKDAVINVTYRLS